MKKLNYKVDAALIYVFFICKSLNNIRDLQKYKERDLQKYKEIN